MTIKVLSDEEIKKKNFDLPLLSIQAADELERLRLKKGTNLEHTKQLSQLIKRDFTQRLDYSIIFSDTYFATYSSNLPSTLDERVPYVEEIFKKLESPLTLDDKELRNLVSFCVNLSDCSELHEQDLESLRGPCFG